MEINVGLVGDRNWDSFAALAPMPQVMKEKDAITYGAVCDGYAVGLAIFCVYHQMAELRWIYVAPQYRRKGVASRLVEEFSKKASSIGIESVNLTYCKETIQEEAFPAFLEAKGFILFPSQGAYDIPISKIAETDNSKLQKVDMSHVVRMDRITKNENESLKALLNEMAASGFMAKGNFISPELSYVVINDSKVTGCLLASERGKKISIDLLLNSKSESNLLALMIAEAKEATQRAKDYDSVLFYAANPKVLQLAKYLFGDIESNGETYIFATALTV